MKVLYDHIWYLYSHIKGHLKQSTSVASNFPGIKMSQQMSFSSNRFNEFKKENSVVVVFINLRSCIILMSVILV